MNCAPASTGVAPEASRRRRGGVWLFFAAWCVGLTAMLSAMARTGCEALGGAEVRMAGVPDEAHGWRIRHWLPLHDPVARTVARLLAARGASAGIEGEIHLLGDVDGLAAELRRGGWIVVEGASIAAGGSERGPRLEFLSPAREIAWRGGYRLDVAPESGGVLLDLAVLGRVARGEPVAPFVSVGCVVPLASGSRGRSG